MVPHMHGRFAAEAAEKYPFAALLAAPRPPSSQATLGFHAWAARAFFIADGMWKRFEPSYVIRWLAVSDRAAFRRSLEHVLGWGFERIVPGHGDVLERGGPAALRTAWRLPPAA